MASVTTVNITADKHTTGYEYKVKDIAQADFG